MRELTPVELEVAVGGRAAEFRTIQIHEISRFDEPPAGWKPERSGTSREAETCTPTRRLPPWPIPMHWLPRRDTEWQVF